LRELVHNGSLTRAVGGRAGGWLFLALLMTVSLAGCGGPSSKCLLSDDRIGESYLYGMNYLEEKNSILAGGAFKSILACNKRFSPAYSGLAIAYAQIATAGMNPDGKTVAASLVALKKAQIYSTGNEDDFRSHIAALRAYTTYKSIGWYEQVQNEYRLAMKTRVEPDKLPYYLGSDSAGYFMGKAYFDAGRIESAMAEYQALYRADRLGRWGRLSQLAFKRSSLILSHIDKAVAGPDVVVLAFRRDVTRADVAAILVGELQVDKLLEIHDVGIGMSRRTSPVPTDISRNPFRGKILKIIRLGIKGLEPSYSAESSSYLFRPRQVVSRKDFAVIMDDIIKRLSVHAPTFRRAPPHKERVYSDVPFGEPWHKAVMDVTSFNLMGSASGSLFRPDEALDGPDVFSAVFGLKQILELR